MFDRIFKVKYISLRKCFAYLSPKNCKELQEKHIRLNYNRDKVAYFSVQSDVSVDDNSIGINRLYAKTLGMEVNEDVTATEIKKLSTIKSLTISPLNKDDYEILELCAENVQSNILNQIRVLNNDQQIVIWVGRGIHVIAFVYDIFPISPGFIDNFTEVVVKPQYFTRRSIPDSINSSTYTLIANCNYFTSKTYKELVENDFFEEYRYKESLFLRVIPFSKIKFIQEINKIPFNVFLFKKSLPNSFILNSFSNFLVFTMTVLDPNSETEAVFHVRLCIFDDFYDDFSLDTVTFDNIFIPDTIYSHINCEIGIRVELKPFFSDIPIINEIEICTKTSFLDVIEENFKAFLGKCCQKQSFLLNSEVILNIGKGLSCFVRFQPVSAKFCLISSDFLRKCKFSVHDVVLPIKDIKPYVNLSNLHTEISNFSEIIKDSLIGLVFETPNHISLENVLIQGSSGTGKTALLNLIEQKLAESPYYMFTRKVDCKQLKGKTLDSLQKFFTNIFIELVHHQPSVLCIDDLQVICGVVVEGDVSVQNLAHFDTTSEMFVMLMEEFCTNNLVSIFATTESALKLNKQIYSTRNIHLFKNFYSIHNLSKDDRKKFLEFHLSRFKLENEDLNYLATKTEGFVVQDLIDLKNKIIYESYVSDATNPKITNEICEVALKNTRMLALQDVKLHSKGSKDFADIGGLNDIKEMITELILWPVKYPKIFDDPPIRLPTGMLFYGAPGTGKTLLAGAAAKFCDIRLISVKGPELLSKYIGASEQGVRDIFEKAQNAKPCILFFDEFDSLAPRRGNDNTGVTDRVVNQFLTQLDGVEVLTGVWVIAATSRPDLLDPALLRPGRLDRKIFFPLPKKETRLEILKVLSKTMIFSEDVDLGMIAEKTGGFTGADLQSVLYTAQMDSLNLDDEEENLENTTPITQDLLINALKNTRPSLSNTERRKFEQIYQKFQGGYQWKDIKADSKLSYA